MKKDQENINDDVPYDPFKDKKWISDQQKLISDQQKLISEREEKEIKESRRKNGLWIEIVDYVDFKDRIKVIKKIWKKEPPINKNDKSFRQIVKQEFKKIKNKSNYVDYVCDPEWVDHHSEELDRWIESLKHTLKYYSFEGKFDNDYYETDMDKIKNIPSSTFEEIEEKYNEVMMKREKEIKKRRERFFPSNVKKNKRKTPIQSKGSLEVLKVLKEILGDDIEIKEEYKFTTNRLFRLDFYFEFNDRKIGVEYQGIQHFKPIKFFGGMRTYLKGKYWDMEKKELCDYHDIELIYFYYDEPITKELVSEKLEIS
jgi:hypothetical protein